MDAVLPDGQPYGQADEEAAAEKRTVAKLLKECKSNANVNSVASIGNLRPILLLMAQVHGGQGLSLVTPAAMWLDLEAFYTAAASVGIGFFEWGLAFKECKEGLKGDPVGGSLLNKRSDKSPPPPR